MKKKKLLEKVLRNPNDVRFSELVKLLNALGFVEKNTQGSHHIFKHPDVPFLINIQNRKGKVKFYQVNQLITLINEFDLTIEE